MAEEQAVQPGKEEEQAANKSKQNAIEQRETEGRRNRTAQKQESKKRKQ